MKKFTLFFLFALLGAFTANAQTASPNQQKSGEAPYKNYSVKFVLDSETPQAVGFDNPKSFWQFRYELRFLEKRFDYQPFREKENESPKDREKRIVKNNKLYDKGWKKNGLLVFKDRILRTQIADSANREITIPLDLSPSVTGILAKAENTWDNPMFRITMRGKAYLLDSSGKKWKQKLSMSFVCPTKTRNDNAQYWMTNSCGIYHEITKTDGGKITIKRISKI